MENKIDFYEYENYEILSGACVHSFPMHIHQSACFGVITNGQVDFRIDGKKTILTKGSIYVIPPYIPHALSSIHNQVFCYSVLCLKNTSCLVSEKEYIVRTLELLENHVTSFPLEDLSDHVSISKYHLIRTFKKQTGITPHQFLLKMKIKKIRQGLLSHQTLSDLTFDLGFSDESHLCRTFKKHMGITPSQYLASQKATRVLYH